MVPYGCGYSTALQHYFRLQSEEEREEKNEKSCSAVRCYFNLGSCYVLWWFVHGGDHVNAVRYCF